MSDRPDIIEMIDNALGDNTVSSDAMRWTPEPLSEPPTPTPDVPALPLAPWPPPPPVLVISEWQRRMLEQVFGEIAGQVRLVVEAMQPLMSGPVPQNPMERALQMRRNRNTGPTPPQRAPRRIDPRRGRG